MEQIPELLVGGIPLIPIILALVQVAKGLGMDVKYAPYMNGVLSVLGYALMVFIKQRPDLEGIVVVILTGLLLFLVNAGVYDLAAKNAIATATRK